MNWSTIIEFIYKHWQAGCEIFFFSATIYYTSLWLRKDKQKNLLLYFYAYTLLFFASYAAHLSSISFFLVLIAPIAGIFFISLHQETLQKNFISLANIKPKSAKDHDDWLEILVRSCLVAANSNKEILILIEHKDSLASLVTPNMPLQAQVQKSLITMMLENATLHQNHMLWVNTNGTILGVNAQWHVSVGDEWFNHDQKNVPQWHLDALLMTAKTDAIIFSCCPLTRTFSIITQGKLFNMVQSPQALTALRSYLEGKSIQLKEEKGAYLYGNIQQKNSSEQRAS